MRVSLIVAMAENKVIGRDGGLPWQLSSDLRRFKQLTMGHHIVMGRRTFESIGRLLPGRTSVIVTRNPSIQVDGAKIAASVDDAIRLSDPDDEVFIIGGAEIYRHSIHLVDRMLITRVEAYVDGDVCFPDFEDSQWHLLQRESFAADEKNDYPHSFEIYERT
jgi:dihydrofolate reductase